MAVYEDVGCVPGWWCVVEDAGRSSYSEVEVGEACDCEVSYCGWSVGEYSCVAYCAEWMVVFCVISAGVDEAGSWLDVASGAAGEGWEAE